ncbi:MAG TPA: type 4a pilus biogenesis protein PilO [Thermoanaerobaculia bacterium]|nr:type 4a pilus biogenesis protein PilO [Thermoanaerobaculia bacterium]
MKTGLEGKPWFYGFGVGLLVGAVLLLAGYFLKLAPMKEEIESNAAQLTELQRKITEGLTFQADLPRLQEDVRNLELELDKSLRILPARRNTPDLLRKIRSLAEAGDFDLKRFTPGALSDKDFYSEWPISVSVEGGYHSLALFFDKISNFSRIINVENLQIDAFSAAKNPHTINANFTAKTFVYKETPPAPAPPAGPAGGLANPAAAGPADPNAPASGPPLSKSSLGSRGGSPE